jgi:hypothetical protein
MSPASTINLKMHGIRCFAVTAKSDRIALNVGTDLISIKIFWVMRVKKIDGILAVLIVE